jgi:hypothetical protein
VQLVDDRLGTGGQRDEPRLPEHCTQLHYEARSKRKNRTKGGDWLEFDVEDGLAADVAVRVRRYGRRRIRRVLHVWSAAADRGDLLMQSLSTTCQQCGRDYELDIVALRQGHASWSLCPDCRDARAQANRQKLAQAHENRLEQEHEGRSNEELPHERTITP